jgi:general secretion pathway protein D
LKIILILLILLTSSIANDLKNITFNEFTSYVSKLTNKPIYLDSDINASISFFIPDQIPKQDLFKVYKNTIYKNGFTITKKSQLYYVTSKSKTKTFKKLYNLKYDTYTDIQKYLQTYDYNSTYISSTNSVLFDCNIDQCNNIINDIKSIDIKSDQVYLKITIFELNDTFKKDVGVQIGSTYKDISNNTQTALNSIIGSINTSATSIPSFDFYSALKLIQENNNFTIKQNPYILTKHNKPFLFEAVKNVPYLVTTSTTSSANTTQQDSYEYKDIGLKIKGKSFIYDDYISLDLNLIIEDILTDTITPTSFKRQITNNTDLPFNSVLVLSGIKRNKKIHNDYSIPYLSNIPFIGKIFEYENTTSEDTTITITIQAVHSLEK